ncbi:MAG: TetR/AcrR family transcriptional regulator [Oscillospiraceae bacterium]
MLTKHAIMDGYMELVVSKGTSEVSVTEICRKCNVSRKTFYYYFVDRYDLLEQIFVEEVEAPLKESMETEQEPKDYLLNFYNHFLLNKSFYIIAIKENGQNSLFENIIERLEKVNMVRIEKYYPDIRQREYISYKFAASQAMLLKKWISEGMDESPEFMAEVFLASLSPKLLKISQF